MKKIRKIFNIATVSASVAIMMGSNVALADTITFDPFAGFSSSSSGNIGVESGYNIVYEKGDLGFVNIDAPENCFPECTFSGTNALYSFNTGSIVITRTDSHSFSFDGLDLAQTFTTLNRSLAVQLTGHYAAGGNVFLTIDRVEGAADTFTTFFYDATTIGFDGLDTLIISGIGTYPTTEFAVDNIVLTAVPEPEIYAMLIVGLGFFGMTANRRKQQGV